MVVSGRGVVILSILVFYGHYSLDANSLSDFVLGLNSVRRKWGSAYPLEPEICPYLRKILGFNWKRVINLSTKGSLFDIKSISRLKFE